MVSNRHDVIQAALALPEADRAEVIARLLDSLGDDAAAMRASLARLTPGNADLLRLAERRQPPRAWLDDESDPFAPEPSR